MLLETHVENDGNPYFTPQNIEDIRVLILQNSLITNVKGLEFLTYLQELYLPGTGISSFEISGLSQLVVLDISNTSISQLDLSHNNLIQQLHCNDCPNLPAIDLTNTPFVWELYCYNSNVSSITGLGEWLEDLRCYNNPVSGVLDLSSSTR
jgi:Leucine-rich repeat (LRR) protein